MWSFLWSSVLLVGIYSFRVLVCHEWRWISWARIHIFHHSLAFSNLIFFLVLFWVNLSVFPLSVLLRVLLTLLPCCLSIRLYCYGLLVAISYSKITQLLLHPVVGMFSRHLPQLVGRIFFRCFGMSCFVCIVLPFLDIFLIFHLSPVLSGLFPLVVISSCVVFSFLSQHVPAFFLFLKSFLLVFVDFLSAFRIEFPIQGFDFLFVLFKGTSVFSQTNFVPA